MSSSGIEESQGGVLNSRAATTAAHQLHDFNWNKTQDASSSSSKEHQTKTKVDIDIDKARETTITSVIDDSTDNDITSSANNTDSIGFLQHEDEFKLDVGPSLVIMILQNTLLQISFFSIVSSSSAYAEYLGGSATFSGLVIGIPTAISGLTLIPLMKYDKGQYKLPLHITCGCMVLGSALYGLAYLTNFLYLILLGRMFQGGGMIGFLYTKRYCTDSRVVGVRRRTFLAGWLVLGQGIGMSAGPFFGGLLYKVGFGSSKVRKLFNGYTGPGWVMAAIWLVFWVVAGFLFEDVKASTTSATTTTSATATTMEESVEMTSFPLPPPSTARTRFFALTKGQWGVVVTMCWFAMTCFFILGGWESNIPVFASSSSSSSSSSLSSSSNSNTSNSNLISLFPSHPHLLSIRNTNTDTDTPYPAYPFSWSPFTSGNFIALGGISIFPFLFLSLFLLSRPRPRPHQHQHQQHPHPPHRLHIPIRIKQLQLQDRHILALGTTLGTLGLLLTLYLIRTQPSQGLLTYPAFWACWFLVALGFNLASTCTLSLLSKRLPDGEGWNRGSSLAIQYSNFTGRLTGAIWGGSGLKVGMLNYLGLEIAVIGIGAVLFLTLWRELKVKTG